MCCAMAGTAKTHIPNNANHEKNCTQLNWRIVSGIFLKSSKMSDNFALRCSPSSFKAFKCAFSSSNCANSSGEYSLVVKMVTKIEPTKTMAPIINDHNKLSGTELSGDVFATPNQLVNTQGNQEPITAPIPINAV